MEQFKAVVIPYQNSISGDKKAALKDLLFSPVIEWVERAVLGNSIGEIYLAENENCKLADIPDSEMKVLEDTSEFKDVSAVFLAAGDTPLITSKDIMNSLIYHKSGGHKVTLFSSFSGELSGMGWYSTDVFNLLAESGVLRENLDDLLEKFKAQNIEYAIFNVDDKFLITADTAKKRASIARVLRAKILDEHLERNVEIQVDDGIIIGARVEIGEGTQIMPGSILRGKTKVGKNCIIGPNSEIRDSIIKDGAKIDSSQIEESEVGEKTKIGPMSHLRPNSKLGDSIKIGNFVEVKNSTIDDKTSVSHLTYVGDSDVGKSCNIGCGVVTVNYDGKNKHRSTIGDKVFIGCNCNLISPVTLEDGAYAAAGTTITEDVPKDSFVIGRSKQTVKKDWCKEKRIFDK